MAVALKVENVSKMYRLGTVGTGTLSHDLNRWWAMLRGKPDPTLKVGQLNDRANAAAGGAEPDYVWALKDINLEVEQGEILGIIGRNGAGKSTLLKLLSRVTAPTTGAIKSRGRIASLLEVGTGFHPELTGRENVYLNGAIMGMTRPEVTKRLDEIVEFSGCAKYIDTPVKRYSSGMTVRLGFAVAAHLDCEILIVDEVLAVGDAEFQKKCVGKMKDISSNSSRTVLFVSHNMNSIEKLCSRVAVLESGTVSSISSDLQHSISTYLTGQFNSKIWYWEKLDDNLQHSLVTPLSFGLRDCKGNAIHSTIRNDEDCSVSVELDLHELHSAFNFGISVHRECGTLMYWSMNTDEPASARLKLGRNEIQCPLPKHFLNEGVYYVSLIMSLHNLTWILEPLVNAPSIRMEIKGGLSDSPFWVRPRPGVCAPLLSWQTKA
jgi:lipopolysaccharide transport system ATP-binding protein